MKCLRAVLPLFLLVFLLSCSENVSIFGPLEEEGDFTVTTIADASILDDERSIPVEFELLNADAVEIPTALDVEVTDESGGIVVATSIEDPSSLGDGIPATVLPELPDGIYQLHLFVRRDAEILETIERQFFVITDNFEVVQTVVFPPTVEPDSLSIARARLIAGETLDPFARWFVDETLVAEGYWRDGADTVRFTTPGDDGVYGLALELFPFGPDRGVDTEVPAPLVHGANLVVSSERAPGPGELGPRADYTDLFHFNGNVQNAAPELVRGGDAVVSEGAQVTIENGVFGYLLDGETLVTIDRTVLPTPGRSALADLVLLPFSSESGTRLLHSAATDGSELTVTVGDSQSIHLRYGSPDGIATEQTVPLGVGVDERVHLRILVEHTGEALLVSLSANGLPVEPVSLPTAVATVPEASDDDPFASLKPGATMLGGEAGVRGILDEFGIRGASGEEAIGEFITAFLERVRLEYGDRLLFADAMTTFSQAEPYTIELPDHVNSGEADEPDETVESDTPVETDERMLTLDFVAGRAGETFSFAVSQLLPDGTVSVIEASDGGYAVTGSSVSIVPEEYDGDVAMLHVVVFAPPAE